MQKLYSRLIGNESYTAGSGSHSFVFQLGANSLHALLESLADHDGVKVKASRIDIKVRFYAYSTAPANPAVFQACVALCQSAGTPSFGSTLTKNTIAEIIDLCFDDDFGYELMFKPTLARRLPRGWNGSDTIYEYIVEFNCRVPKKMLNLLNKEIQTERLQNLYLLGIAQCDYDSLTIYKSELINVNYSEVAKELVIR